MAKPLRPVPINWASRMKILVYVRHENFYYNFVLTAHQANGVSPLRVHLYITKRLVDVYMLSWIVFSFCVIDFTFLFANVFEFVN